MDNKELIWVEKEFAEKFKILEKDASKNEQRIEALDEYMKTVSDKSKREFKSNLESLDEDVAIYTGLMLRVKQAFEKAKDEQLSASYALWEKFDAELPKVDEKIDTLIKTIQPLEEKINNLNDMLSKIQTYNIEKLVTAIKGASDLYGQDKKMFEFLIKNFKEKKEK